MNTMNETNNIVPLTDSNPAILTHPRRLVIKCWDELLEDCYKLSTFTSRIESKAKKIAKLEKVDFFDKYGEDGAMAFKGDVTEVFAEYVFLKYGPTLGVWNYTPFFTINGAEQDVGVDGLGRTKNGKTVTVQIKFGNWAESLDYTRRRLRTFHWTSIRKYGVGTASKDQMFVFTLAHDINWRTLGGHFHGRLKFVALEQSGGISMGQDPVEFLSLNKLIGNSPMFWQSFAKSLKG